MRRFDYNLFETKWCQIFWLGQCKEDHGVGTALSLEFLNPRRVTLFPLLVHADNGHRGRSTLIMAREYGVLVRIFDPQRRWPFSPSCPCWWRPRSTEFHVDDTISNCILSWKEVQFLHHNFFSFEIGVRVKSILNADSRPKKSREKYLLKFQHKKSFSRMINLYQSIY